MDSCLSPGAAHEVYGCSEEDKSLLSTPAGSRAFPILFPVPQSEECLKQTKGPVCASEQGTRSSLLCVSDGLSSPFQKNVTEDSILWAQAADQRR